MELKNCPFCGGKATKFEYSDRYLAQCDACSFALTPEEWNRRAESDLAAETLKWKMTDEALRASCDEVAKLKRENTDLLVALKDILDNDGSDGHYDATLLSIARKAARAAIARHEHE